MALVNQGLVNMGFVLVPFLI